MFGSHPAGSLTVSIVISPHTLVNSTDSTYITRMAVNPDRLTRKLVSIPNELLKAIEDFRFQQRIKTESEAIRRLIEAGLSGQAAPKPEPSSASEPGGDQAAEPVASKPSPRKTPPRAKAAAMSKEAQIRALRERDGQ